MRHAQKEFRLKPRGAFEEAASGIDAREEGLPEKASGEASEGEFWAIVCVAAVRDVDDLHCEHTFK